MRLGSKYICDKCGCDVEHPKSLTTFFQSGVAFHRKNPYGVRHMCLFCKQQFDLAFTGFFKHYNTIKNELAQD